MTTHNENIQDGDDMEDFHESMKKRIDGINDGFKEVNESLDRVEANIKNILNRIRSQRVKRMVEDYEKGERHVAGNEVAFFNRVIWTDDHDDNDGVIGFGHEYSRERSEDGGRTEVKIQLLPDIRMHFLTVLEYNADNVITSQISTWARDEVESMAYAAEFLGFDNVSQIELE
jgi:hypothetical protein